MNTPQASARSIKSSFRLDATSPRNEIKVSSQHNLPPIKVDHEVLMSSRSSRPFSSSARSDVSIRSEKNTPLSAKLKNSPYAIPISARSGASSSRNIASSSSERGSIKLKVIGADGSVLVLPEEISSHTPPLTQEDTAQGSSYRQGLCSEELAGRDMAQVHETEKPKTPDGDLFDELFGQDESKVDENDPSETFAREFIDDNIADYLVDSDRIPCSGVPESILQSIDQLAEEDPIKEVPIELQHDPRQLQSDVAQYSGENLVQSAISTIYCGNSTFIASIPEEMDLAPSDEQRNVGAPSPPEPSPTPAEDFYVTEEEDLSKSLTEALVEVVSIPHRAEEEIVEADSPSPVNGIMEVSQYSMVTMDVHNVATLETQIREELGESDGNVVQQNTQRRSNVWKRVFCCGK